MRIFLLVLVLALPAAIAVSQPHDASNALQTPRVIRVEHTDIHRQLSSVIDLAGATGAAAQEVAEVLHPHFEQEEQYAMPVLGVLRDLANGKATAAEKKEALELSTELRRRMPAMLAEHEAIVKKLDKLTAVALSENKPLAVEFVDRLKTHAEQEEQILYPAALLVGDLLKSKAK